MLWKEGNYVKERKTKNSCVLAAGSLIGVLAAVMVLLCGCNVLQRGQLISLEDKEESVETTSAEGSLESSTIESTASKEAEEEDFIWVFVCGAVESPQVVKLPVGSRAMVAVKMAGGMTEDADESFVNLAAILEDGEKLYIPTKEGGSLLKHTGRKGKSCEYQYSWDKGALYPLRNRRKQGRGYYCLQRNTRPLCSHRGHYEGARNQGKCIR